MLPDFYPIEQEAEKEISEIYLSDLFNKTDPLWSPVLASPYLRGGKINIGSANKTFKFEPDKGIWLGAQDFNSAPFRVTMDGKVYATNVEISGKIIAGAGSAIDWSYIKNVLVDTAQIKDLAVTNAKIASGLSASKITTGTLDASVVNVINLNADNITTGTLTGRRIRTAPAGNARTELVPSDDPNRPNELVFFRAPDAIVGAVYAKLVDSLAFLELYALTGIKLKPLNVSILEVNTNGVYISQGCYPTGNYDLGSSNAKWRHLYLSGNIYIDGTVDGVDISAHAANANAHHPADCSGYTIYPAGISTTGSCYLGWTYTYDVIPRSNNYYELGSTSYKWYRIYVTKINGVGTIDLENHLKPVSAGAQINLGNPTDYFNEIFAKYFTDVGCLGWFDEGVELLDGRIVSDLEALENIKPHPTKRTIHGVPQLDYSTLPKPVYRPAPIAEEDIYDEETKKIKFRKGEKMGEDGAELTALISIMIGAIKELNRKVESLEVKINGNRERKI